MDSIEARTEPNPMNFAMLNGFAAGLYLALGALGLSFAIDPGYASPIFPAAGFAVAILLYSEKRAWPGIWLGSLALNLGFAWFHGDLSGDLNWRGALLAAVIASGSVAQAMAASWLLARGVKKGWQTLETDSDIIRVLALAGPIACVISACTGVAALYWAQVIPGSEIPYAWWNWWSGDTLGVLIMLPLSLSVIYRRHSPWRARFATLVLPMAIMLGLVAGAFYAATQWQKAQLASAIQSSGEALVQRLEQRILAHQEALSALHRLVEVTPAMRYAQFEHFTRITLKDNPDIFALSINPRVLSEKRQAFERGMAATLGSAAFEIRERDSERRLVRAGPRPDYVPVGFIAPREGNSAAIGYDINSDPARHDAIGRALRSHQAALTAPLQLVQENRQRIGVLLLHPSGEATQDAALGPERFAGFVVGVIKVDEMVAIATRSTMIPGLLLAVDDAASPADKALLYRSSGDPGAADERYLWRKEIPFADRLWTVKVFPTEDYLRQHHHWLALAVGACGLLLAALLQMLLLVTSGRTSIVQRKVLEQTRELQIKSESLEDRNAQLDALFALSPDGFVAFAQDGTVKFVNPAFQTMTGISYASVVGKSEAELDAALRLRCDRPEQFAGIADCFSLSIDIPQKKVIALNTPRQAVLQMIGIRSNSSSISRILYVREITRETEVDRMKSEFLSHAAHELRTPLASIFGYSELLLEVALDETTRRDCLETIHRQTSVLVDIINELLDLSRIEARRGLDLKLGEVDLATLVRATASDFTTGAGPAPLLLDLPAQPRTALADPAKLRQALTNVLANAIKYSPAGGEIRVSLLEAPGRVGIAVSDQGIGMSPEQLSHFGERFWRADSSGKTPGTGLGLAIVKEILLLLCGSLEVSSQLGQGTTISLWLPGKATLPDSRGIPGQLP